MRFEFDPAKSARNKAKHGIDFIEAQALWLDVNRLEIDAKTVNEPRRRVTGQIGNVLWSAIITYRHGEETIRIISVRRARDEERHQYDSDFR